MPSKTELCFQKTIPRLLELIDRGYTQAEAAEALNAEGYRNARGGSFNQPQVCRLLARHRQQLVPAQSAAMATGAVAQIRAIAQQTKATPASEKTLEEQGLELMARQKAELDAIIRSLADSPRAPNPLDAPPAPKSGGVCGWAEHLLQQQNATE